MTTTIHRSVGEPAVLPFDRPASAGTSSTRLLLSRDLPVAASELRNLADELRVPPEQVVLAAWTVVLSAYARAPLVHLEVATERSIVAIEVDAGPQRSFTSLSEDISASLQAAQVSAADGSIVFVLDRHDASTATFSVRLELAGETGALAATYDPARLERSTAARILDHLATVVAGVVASGVGAQVDSLPVLPAEELALLRGWNATRVEWDGVPTLASLLEDAIERHPSSVAIEYEGRRVSYREFGELAARVAGRLIDAGVGRGALVGVLCDRSVELVAALHGIVLAGAAYVPLNPDDPSDRIGFMVGETQMRVVVSHRHLRALVTDPAVLVLDAEELVGRAYPQGATRPVLPQVQPDDLAYVIYTSGSTGRPKGVANAHRGVANRLLWMQDRYPSGPGNVFLQKTPYGFDVSVWEFFWPLQVGARLIVAEPGGHRDPAYLVQTIVGNAVDTVHFVPSMLRLFLDHPAAGSCTSLSKVICSGEALTRDLQDRFFAVLPRAELHNLYGPTEAAIDVTAWQCRPDDERRVVPIGAPIANTTIHILDDAMRPVPIGISGELHIGGTQVAVGYVNRAELTAERFVPDPFDPAGRLYKTGDLARWLPDGQVDFLGRSDHQIKIRGQRVELGEIEAVLGEHPGVLEAAVSVVGPDEDPSLVAHVAARPQPIDESRLRAFLETRLPAHMIPARFVAHEELPLTGSGKVDRKLLAEGLTVALEPRAVTAGADELERFLLDAWRSVLDRADVGRDDRVAELGATSLQAAAFVNRVQRELGEFIYVVTVFTAPTVREYAALLARDYPQAVARRFGSGAAAGQPSAPRRIDDAGVERLSAAVPRFGPFPSWRQGQRNPPAVFILSPPRSGTTLLRVMLAGHSRLFAAPELQLLGFDTLGRRRAALDGRFSAWREGTIRAVMELEACDAEQASQLMESFERDGSTAKAFYGWLQAHAGDRVVVDKSPGYALDLEALRNAEHGFDGARYIHLVRDPLAMARSFESYHMDQILLLDEHPWSGRTLGELVWTLSHRNILQFAQEVPAERLLRVHFEDLVSDPRATMTAIASFLELEFEESLVQPYQNLEAKMVDGLHPESTPMGDTRLLERNRIDPAVARRAAPAEAALLGDPTVRLARQLGRGRAKPDPASAGRRDFAAAARARRAARRPGG